MQITSATETTGLLLAMYSCISEEEQGIIVESLFCYDDSTSLSLAQMQKQEPNNCGIFVVAVAAAIIFSCNPSELQFEESEM